MTRRLRRSITPVITPITVTPPTPPLHTGESAPPHIVTGSHFGITPTGIRLTECTSTLNESSWPADLILDLGKSNWMEWSCKLTLLALRLLPGLMVPSPAPTPPSLLNSMGKHCGPLQPAINSMSSTPGFTSETIATCLLDEDTPIRRHAELGQPANPYMPTSSLTPSSTSAAVSSRPRSPRPKKAKGNYRSYQREISTG
jgi:hypothetical protein